MPFVRRSSSQASRTPVNKAGDMTSVERALARAYAEAVRLFREGVNTQRVADAIRQSVSATLQALPTGSLIGDLRPIVDALVKEIIKSGKAEASATPVGMRFRFDEADPRATQWALERAGQLVKDISDEVEQIISETVADAVEGNISVAEAQRRIARQVGLHERWRKAVENTNARLMKQFLASGMTVEQATLQAQKASEKYQERLIRARSKNIARTEIATAQNEGRWVAWQQAGDAGLVNLKTSMKEWRTAPEFVSSKTIVCDICAPLDGKRIPVDENFQTGLRAHPDGIKMPPAHPSCRCRAVLVPLSFSEIEARVLEARRQEAQRT
jgi:hypothetical protein